MVQVVQAAQDSGMSEQSPEYGSKPKISARGIRKDFYIERTREHV
jgi:hypothetical protein